MNRVRATGCALVFCGAVAGAGCAHIANLSTPGVPAATSSSSASPGSTPSASATGGTCSITTRDPDATIVISMDPDFAAATTTYGSIFGYAAYDPTGLETPPPAAATVAATTADLIVFANYDPGLTSHTATGFLGATAFPAEPYPFPASDTDQVATTISSAAWSTGTLASFGNTSSTICYSQTFALPSAGTFYFGDDPLYNSASSFRGVISVSN